MVGIPLMAATQTSLTSPDRRQDAGPPVRAFTRLLRAHASTTRLLSAELLEQHGLTINDYETLLVLSHADGRRLKRVELARQLLLTPSGITRMLEGLEAAGLVERQACPSDLRVAYARLTDSGAARLQAATCSHVASITALFEAHLSEAEISGLADTLDKLPGVAGTTNACQQD
jgi:DNA-binding MarR family transcriptional regulator